MFRSIFDHPQGDIFSFTSVTKDKIIWFVVALPSVVQQQPDWGEHIATSTQSTTSITGMLPQTR